MGVASLHILPVSMRVYSEYSDFLPQPINMHLIDWGCEIVSLIVCTVLQMHDEAKERSATCRKTQPRNFFGGDQGGPESPPPPQVSATTGSGCSPAFWWCVKPTSVKNGLININFLFSVCRWRAETNTTKYAGGSPVASPNDDPDSFHSHLLIIPAIIIPALLLVLNETASVHQHDGTNISKEHSVNKIQTK